MSEHHAKPTSLTDTRKQPEPDLRPQPLAGERYTSREFMQREWERVFCRTWQIGCLESEIPRSGDYVTHEFGRESLIFVRDDETIRGWYNVCHHRGNRLVRDDRGRAGAFVCPYHGWVWGKDGELTKVQDPEDFPGGNPCGSLRLTAVRVDTLAGFVWFNLDPDAESLQRFLEPVAREIDTYEMQRMVRTHWIARYVDGQLTDHYHYTVFPNIAFSMKPDGCIFLRPNPHPTDAEKCLFDVWYFALFPDGVDEIPARSMSEHVRRDDDVPHQQGGSAMSSWVAGSTRMPASS